MKLFSRIYVAGAVATAGAIAGVLANHRALSRWNAIASSYGGFGTTHDGETRRTEILPVVAAPPGGPKMPYDPSGGMVNAIPLRETKNQASDDDRERPAKRSASFRSRLAEDAFFLAGRKGPPLSPPLGSLIQEANGNDTASDVIGDVQWLLQFAIIAHPKCATTFTLKWLRTHPQVRMEPHEVQYLPKDDPAGMVRSMYDIVGNGVEKGDNNDMPYSWYRRGYKAPRDLMSHKALSNIARYWPETRLIVGVRHPILWFQSFYNYRVRMNYTMPHPNDLVGRCTRSSNNVCTDEAMFHVHLSRLRGGKTTTTTTAAGTHPGEKKLPQFGRQRAMDGLPPLTNPVFLYEISQLHDANETRAERYRADLSGYLGLHEPLVAIAEKPTSRNSGYEGAMDICEPQYGELRHILLRHGSDASLWIRKHFMEQPDVHVSSPDHFRTLLESWTVDPCDA